MEYAYENAYEVELKVLKHSDRCASTLFLGSEVHSLEVTKEKCCCLDAKSAAVAPKMMLQSKNSWKRVAVAPKMMLQRKVISKSSAVAPKLVLQSKTSWKRVAVAPKMTLQHKVISKSASITPKMMLQHQNSSIRSE